MNRYRLSCAGIQAGDGLKRVENNRELYESLLCRFTEDFSFSEISEHVRSGDLNTAFRLSHAMKGVAANLSINRLYEKICPLVEALRSEKREEAETYLNSAEQAFNEACRVIREEKERDTMRQK